jgi:hypothetical protein
MSPPTFAAWGWRIPLPDFDRPRRHLALHPAAHERVTDLSAHQDPAGLTSARPLKEGFHRVGESQARVDCRCSARPPGQGVIWYTGQFYALFYLQTILRVNPTSGELHRRNRAALRDAAVRRDGRALGPHRSQAPDDAGCLLAVVSYVPIYHAMQRAAGSAS